MTGLAWCVFGLLRSQVGNALHAIRDSAEAALFVARPNSAGRGRAARSSSRAPH